MRPSKWQNFLSYFWPIRLSKGLDARQRPLDLHLIKGRLRLQVDEAIYSYDDLYHVFQKAFTQVPILNIKNTALILGYGLGSIPYILETQHGLKLTYTGIELDATIMELAQKYASPRLQSNINIIQTNAQNFVATNHQKYDLICIDLFVGREVPAFAKSDHFLNQIATALSPKGLLLFNYLKNEGDDFEAFAARFQTVFPNGQCLDLDSNFMLVSF